MTMQEMIDTAMIEGASIYWLWSMGFVSQYAVKVTDDGTWYFVDTADHPIDEADARRLLDCFQTGYID